MRKPIIAHWATALLFLAAAPTATAQSEWTRVATGAGTGCALGTPYSFFYRDGSNADKLLIYFQGGGACWNWVSCSGLFDSSVEPDETRAFRGIFDTSDPRNPLRDYSVVFVPYCTADVHIGNASASYGDRGSRPIAHWGCRNVDAVLGWLGNRGLSPKTVVVAGTSAGAYGALFHTGPIARLFPDSRVVLLGDSGVPLLNGNADVLRGWRADSVAAARWRMGPDSVTLLQAYRQVAQLGSRVRLAQITSDQDAIQSAFYLVSGSAHWRRATYSLLADVATAVPEFRSFILSGSDHGLLPVNGFYSYRVGDVLLSEWVRRLIDGEAVANVRCPTCVP